MKIKSEISLDLGDTESKLATREDNPIPGGVACWNEAQQRFDTINLISSDNSTYYVDGANGSDTNHGLTPSTAFKTISKAIETIYLTQIFNGDVAVIAAPCFYDETVVFPAGLFGKGTISLFGASDVSGAENYYIKEIQNNLHFASGITTAIKGFKVDVYSGRLTQNDNIIIRCDNSQLSSLETDIELTPLFSPEQYTYSGNAAGLNSIAIIATLADTSAILKVNGVVVQSGIDKTVNLTLGTNIITIEIIPMFGPSSQYILTVQKDS